MLLGREKKKKKNAGKMKKVMVAIKDSRILSQVKWQELFW